MLVVPGAFNGMKFDEGRLPDETPADSAKLEPPIPNDSQWYRDGINDLLKNFLRKMNTLG